MRNIHSNDIVEILNTSFGFEIIETQIGLGVISNPYDAFIFSSITGAGYLENKIFPFTPKGQMKVFQNVFENKFVTGLLENFSFRYSPYYLNTSREYLFKGSKIIVPVEFENEQELRVKLDLLTESNNSDYIILRLETYKKGFGLEPFMEYLACRFFNNLGYITENQIPLFPTVGSPDFGGFKNYTGFELSGLELFNKGFNILELSLIRLFNLIESQQIFNDKPHIIVGEAKTSTTNINKQIQKYIETELFNESIEIFPFYQSSSSNSSFYIDSNHKLRYEKKSILKVDFAKQNSYLDWMKNYFKYYILSNYSNDEFRLYFKSVTGLEYNENKLMTDFIEQISISSLIGDLKKYIKHGTF
jgi:hypothetical protein